MSIEEKKNLITSYKSMDDLNDSQITNLNQLSQSNILRIKKISFHKAKKFILAIPELCSLHYTSLEYRKLKNSHPMKHHPIKPMRGEIYYITLKESIGSELQDNHLVIIMSNSQTNIYAEKVNVLPIEGDGKVVPTYLEQLTTADLEYGKLDKDPSRVIIPEPMTIDKARLGVRIGKVRKEKMDLISKKLKKQLNI